MTILIIGSPEEEHAAFIHHKIKARGGQPLYFNTRHFPSIMRLSLHMGATESGLGMLDDGEGTVIPLAEISAVYWRYHLGIELAALNDQFLADMAYREIDSTLGSLFRMLPCRWVNSPEAIALHTYKPYQLQLLHQAGIRVPKTLVTNDPQTLRAFYDALDGNVIYKPVRGGAHTARLKSEDLTEERLAELAKAPVKFQEMVEGVDVRAYLVQEEIFAAEIRSSTLDFRDDPAAPIIPVSLPASVIQDCHTVAETLGLVYTGIDIRKTPQAEHVFLESNPCPMFIHFERQAGYPISDRLVDLLMLPSVSH